MNLSKSIKLLVASVLILVGFQPAQALWRDKKIGWFDIVQAEKSCGAIATYEFDGRPDVTLMVILGADGKIAMSLASYGWSAEQDESYPDIEWNVNGQTYGGKSVGIRYDDGTRGFLGTFGPEMLDDLSKGSSLFVTKGEATVTHINLTGSGAAIAALRACATDLKAQLDAKQRRERKWNYIEKDPFGGN